MYLTGFISGATDIRLRLQKFLFLTYINIFIHIFIASFMSGIAISQQEYAVIYIMLNLKLSLNFIKVYIIVHGT